MTRRALRVAGVAWREEARQPGLWLSTAGVSALLCLGVGALVLLVEAVLSDPASAALFAHNLEVAGLAHWEGAALGDGLLATLRFLLVAQLLGTTAVLAAQSMLHDRQVGTLPFLLLSPLGRGELLAGRALGALGLPLAVYLVFSGGCALFLGLVPTGGLALGLWVGAPAWAAWLAVLGALLSHAARDVRGAQQGVWALVLAVTATVGGLLTLDSVGLQVGLALAGWAALGVTLAGGTALLTREIRRG